MRTIQVLLVMCVSATSLSRSTVIAQDKSPTPRTVRKFVRVLKENGKVVALQTAWARYVSVENPDLEVDLHAMVHFADRSFYNRLKTEHADDDAVLFELVTMKGLDALKAQAGRRSETGALRALQKLFPIILDLAAQEEEFDLLRPPKNWVHADLSFEQMGRLMRERGDDAITVGLSVAADLLRQHNLQQRSRSTTNSRSAAPSADQMVDDLLSNIRNPVRMKRMMATQLASQGSDIPFAAVRQVIVKDRNAAAMRAFQKQLASGKKRFSLPWGAAHMPDFERRLILDFGLKLQSVEWVTAWDLKDRPRTEEEDVQRMVRLYFRVIKPILEEASRN